jgi:hypothetical protein
VTNVSLTVGGADVLLPPSASTIPNFGAPIAPTATWAPNFGCGRSAEVAAEEVGSAEQFVPNGVTEQA